MLSHTTQEAMPAFVSMVAMPYTFSIGYGIIGGLLLWTLGMIFFVSHGCTLQQKSTETTADVSDA